MEAYKKTMWISVTVTILIALMLWFFLFRKPDVESPSISKETISQEKTTETSKPPETEKKDTEGFESDLSPLDLDLSKSDQTVRELIKTCSSHQLWAEWIKTDDLIRKFVASVDMTVQGHYPVVFLEFLVPKKKFRARLRGEQYFINPKSFNRFNTIGEVVVSLDTDCCIRLYKRLKPTLEKAFKKLGYPDETFHLRLKEAMEILKKTPVVTGNIPLEKKLMSYAFKNPKLEKLNPVQKLFIRMGPKNIGKIQKKLKEFSQALDFE